MNVTLSMYLIVCPLVFLAAVVDAIGGGGGLISLPAYYLAGLSPTLRRYRPLRVLLRYQYSATAQATAR